MLKQVCIWKLSAGTGLNITLWQQKWSNDLHSYLKNQKNWKQNIWNNESNMDREEKSVNSGRQETNELSPGTAPFATLNVQAPSQKKGTQLEPSEPAELRTQKWFSGEDKAIGEIEKFIIIIGVFNKLLWIIHVLSSYSL